MKLIECLFFLFSMTAFAETFYYSDHYLNVDLRADQPSLIRFEAPPISSSCQPGILRFDPLEERLLSFEDKEHLQEKENKDTLIHQLIRVTPQEKEGVATCSFTLTGGITVPIKFHLTEAIARPFLDFRSVSWNSNKAMDSKEEFTLFQSILTGNSIHLHEITKDFDLCSHQSDRRDHCSHLTHRTEKADYELVYSGTDGSSSAWIFLVSLRKDQKFDDISDLKISLPNLVFYSAVTPQKNTYQIGDMVKHHILAPSQTNQRALLEVLP